jgi:protocatechuate 3,4-dioxygenase beta subunit
MFLSKPRIVTILLMAVLCGAAALGLLTHCAQAAREADAAQAEPPPSATKGEEPPPRVDGKDTVPVRGRVLDLDGKPVAGAKLYLHTFSPKDQAPSVRATSGADGQFEFTFAWSELNHTYSDNPVGQVLAVGEGLGFDVAIVGEPGKDGELTLRLVKDVPINGRIVDLEGKPVNGAKVRVTDVLAYKGEDLTEALEVIRKGGMGPYFAKSWSGPLPGQAATVTTGADGRFRITGLGRERLVRLIVEGPGIRYMRIEAMTRVGEAVVNPDPHRQQRIHGATFDHYAEPARPIRGVVRDKETGKPVAGVQVGSFATTHTAVTDKEGRYELLGCPKSKEHQVSATPAEGQPYFVASASFPDTPGLGALDGDIPLVRGIVLSGHVTDKETGKPLRAARVEYHPVYPNPNTRDGSRESSATTAADGAFTLVVLPGPGLLAVATYSSDFKYMSAQVTLKEMKESYKDWADPGGNSEQFLLVAAGGNAARGLVQENYNAIVLIEPDAKADKLTREVALQPARTVKGSVAGADGKPLAGVTIFGLGPNLFGSETLKTADFTVHGLNPKRTRQLLFLYPERGLGLYQEIRGDEAGPLTVKLQPLGSASGRVVDKDGQPVAGLVLNVNRTRLLGPGGTQVKTDKEGRFRADGLVPGQKYDLAPLKQSRIVGPKDAIVVEPGKDKDLGDITLESGN